MTAAGKLSLARAEARRLEPELAQLTDAELDVRLEGELAQLRARQETAAASTTTAVAVAAMANSLRPPPEPPVIPPR